jgi:hypothetical protein
MAFILLHRENGFCGHESALINVEQIASVFPVIGTNKWYIQQSSSTLQMTDGKTINILEPLEKVMGLLREATGGQKMPGTGPQVAQSIA